MKRRLWVLSILFVTGIAVTMGLSTSTAQAKTSCNRMLCMYLTDDYTGDYWAYKMPKKPDYVACITLPKKYNNTISSIRNTQNVEWYVYDWVDCHQGGARSIIHPNSSGKMNATWNNRITSIIVTEVNL